MRQHPGHPAVVALIGSKPAMGASGSIWPAARLACPCSPVPSCIAAGAALWGSGRCIIILHAALLSALEVRAARSVIKVAARAAGRLRPSQASAIGLDIPFIPEVHSFICILRLVACITIQLRGLFTASCCGLSVLIVATRYVALDICWVVVRNDSTRDPPAPTIRLN